MGNGNDIFIPPPPPGSGFNSNDNGGGSSPPPGGGTGSGGSGSGSGTGSGGNGSGSGHGSKDKGGGGGGYKAKARKKYLDQVADLQQQVQAILDAVGPHGEFNDALRVRLHNIGRVQRQQDKILLEGYRSRVGSLKQAAEDNEMTAADQTVANVANRSRERANALSEAMLQGAGESDLLRTQMMSLRAWDGNQNEVERGYRDTLSSINASLNDLNVDTKTARSNIQIEANADREQLWTQYYQQQSEAYTNLGNIYGQQGELLGYAQEMGGKTKGRHKKVRNQMGDAFDNATDMAGQAWHNPGLRRGLRRWEGHDDFEGDRSNSSLYRNATTNLSVDKPEGASLRSW